VTSKAVALIRERYRPNTSNEPVQAQMTLEPLGGCPMDRPMEGPWIDVLQVVKTKPTELQASDTEW
jgi:hypothetical protein